MAIPDYPLTFEPVYKDYIWGGRRIPRKYERGDAPGNVCAESWEISDRTDGMSVVTNGPHAGTSLAELLARYPDAMLGAGVDGRSNRFPLLIKLIDAKETLSVQVHPDDDAAARYGGEAKTEMWVILEAGTGSGVYAGLKPNVTEASFREALKDERIEAMVPFREVTPGDVIFVPGGRVHAIGAGCLLLEVQQNSNTTYRVYDWGREAADGTRRELHIDDACRVIRWNDGDDPCVPPGPAEQHGSNQYQRLLDCAHFRLDRLSLQAPFAAAESRAGVEVLFIAEGATDCRWAGGAVSMRPGSTWLIPAALASYELSPECQSSTVIRIRPGR